MGCCGLYESVEELGHRWKYGFLVFDLFYFFLDRQLEVILRDLLH